MTKEQLIGVLEGLPDGTEIRLAMQPSWPFEYSIQDEPVISGDQEAFAEWVEDEYDDILEWVKQRGLKDEPHRISVGDMDEYGEVTLEVWDDDDGFITSYTPEEIPIAPSQFGSNIVYLAEERQIGYLPSEIKEKLSW